VSGTTDEPTGHVRVGSEYGATWSPDGTRVAYIAAQPSEHGFPMIAMADGSDAKRLINEPVFYLTPRWSPDGTMIVVQTRDQDPPIWVVDSTTGTVRAKLSFAPASFEDDTPGSADIWSFERVLP
jgi:Tol biopolymer transport system component